MNYSKNKGVMVGSKQTQLRFLSAAITATCLLTLGCNPGVDNDTKDPHKSTLCRAAGTSNPPVTNNPLAKNVILMIVDGASNEQYTLARWFKGSALAFDEYLVGMVKTHISNSVIADSAPMATAFASGVRTSNQFIGVGPHGKTLSTQDTPDNAIRYRPLGTVLEGARLLGKATGVVATSSVCNATPAAFISHSPTRSSTNEMMEQAVYQGLDLVLGGGSNLLRKDLRPDKEDLQAVLENRGYTIVSNQAELDAHKQGRLFGLFASGSMAADLDRKEFAPKQPTLKEMTIKAIELLSKDPDGFFLMVEGSQVDWGAHSNDPAHVLGDLMAFEKAVAAALAAVKNDNETLLLVLSDHATGGMTIGNTLTDKSYNRITVEQVVEPFKKMQLTAAGIVRKLGDDKSAASVKQAIATFWGIQITDEESIEIANWIAASPATAPDAIGSVVSRNHTVIGWTTFGHTAGDVPLFALGPGAPRGLLDGPDIGTTIAAAMDISLPLLTERLFVDVEASLPSASIEIKDSDSLNPVLSLEFDGKVARLPINKNLLEIDGKTHLLEGLVLQMPKRDTEQNSGRFFVPLQAIRILKNDTSPLPSLIE
jgi:alkaline phosphatase